MHLVIPIAASGHGCTSTAFLESWRFTRYEYVDASGKLTRLGVDRRVGGVIVWPIADNRESNESYLFVGTKEDFRKEGGNMPRF